MTDTIVERDGAAAVAGELAAAAAEVLAGLHPVDGRRAPADLARTWNGLAPQLHELGWFDLLTPEPDGGLGLPPEATSELFGVFGRQLAPGPLLEQIVLVPLLVARSSGGAGRDRLRELGAGGGHAALLDGSLSGAPALHDDRPRVTSGRLHGRMHAVPHADSAAVLIVVAHADGLERIHLVARDARGVAITAQPAVDPCSTYATVLLDDVDPGPALDGAAAAWLLGELRCWYRLLTAAQLSGIARTATSLAVDHARMRHQFGRPIGSFQAVKHLLAEMTAEVSGLANLVAVTVAEHSASDAAERVTAAMAAKAWAADVAVRTCERSLQVHGGVGFTTELPLHLYLKRSLALASRGGESGSLYREIARRQLAGAIQEQPLWRHLHEESAPGIDLRRSRG